jgi:hypothetical protein
MQNNHNDVLKYIFIQASIAAPSSTATILVDGECVALKSQLIPTRREYEQVFSHLFSIGVLQCVATQCSEKAVLGGGKNVYCTKHELIADAFAAYKSYKEIVSIEARVWEYNCRQLVLNYSDSDEGHQYYQTVLFNQIKDVLPNIKMSDELFLYHD